MPRFPALICAAALSSTVLSSAVVPTVIVGARLIDGTGTTPIEDSVVVVEGDRIRAAGPRARIQIPRNAAIVDAKAKVLMPGLVDVHCHINQPPDEMKRYWLAQLRWGVTTMRSAGNDKPETVPLFRQTRAGDFLAPRSYTAGQGFNVSGPYPGAPTFKPTTPDEARSNVRELKAQKVDFIKIWMTKPLFPADVIAAIVDEGRKQGITVIAHVTDVASLHQLADLGVTDFLHNPVDQPVTPELIAYAKRKKLTFAPTLANIESKWFYYEHPDILNMPMLQTALYPRGRQMLADAERKAQRVDFIKIWMTKPLFPPEVIAAIVDEGRKQGITVIAHVTDVASLHQLADLGVTDFLHNPIDQPVTPDLIAYAKRKNLTFAPTLANIESRWFYYEHPDILNMPMLQAALYPRGRQMLADAEKKAQALSAPDLAQRKARMREQTYPFIKAMSDAGVRIVTGTDCGAEASQVTPFGHATHREVQMFVEAGMSPLAAIRAATLDAARVVSKTEDPEYGSIGAGKVADLLLLDKDPSVDIGNTITISRVMRAGAWVP